MSEDIEMELQEREEEIETLKAEIWQLKHDLAFYKEQADYYRDEAAENYGSWQATKKELEELESATDSISLNGGHY